MDASSLTLGHSNSNTVSKQVNQLTKQNLKLSWVAKGCCSRANTLNISVVICSPDINNVVDALELIPVVGYVGSKIGILAICFDEYAVLIVTKISRTEEKCALVRTIEVAKLIKSIKRAIDSIFALVILNVERALREPHIKVGTSVVAGVFDGLKHHLVTALTELNHALIFGLVCPDLSVIFEEEKTQVNNVVSSVCIAAKRIDELVSEWMLFWMCILFICNVGIAIFSQHLSSCISVNAALLHDVNKLQVTLGDGVTKDIHLRTVIVYVVLALNLIACECKNTAQRVSQRCPATVANMQRTNRVCRNVLYLDLLASTKGRTTKIGALLANGVKNLIARSGRQVKVYKARTCNLNALNLSVCCNMSHKSCGNIARSLMCQLCRTHCNRRRPVTI